MPFLIFVLFLGIGLAFRSGALADPDTGWHVAAGDLIRSLGRLPEHDPWSFTAGDHPWYNISWAYDVAISFVHETGGLAAVAATTIVLNALAAGALGAIALQSSKSVIAAVPATILAGLVLLPGMLARPQGVTYLLILAFYAVLRFGGSRLWWLLPAGMAAWANIHGGFLAGLAVIGAFFVEKAIKRDFVGCLNIAGVGALALAAILINPYGSEIIHATSLTLHSVMKPFIMEWRPAPLSEINPNTIYVAAFFVLSALFAPNIPLADKLLAASWLALGLQSGRMMQIAALLGAPYLAQAIALRLYQTPAGPALRARDAIYLRDLRRPAVVGVLATIAVAAAAASFLAPVQRLIAGGEVFAAFPERTAPDGALDFIRARYPGLRLYNEYGFGGYMVYRDRGATPVFADGRADTAYPAPVLKDVIAIGVMDPKAKLRAGDADWKAAVDRYGVSGFLISHRARLDDFLVQTPDWRKVYDDGDAALFVRADLVHS